MVLAISPHLTRPLQSLTRWLLTLGVLAAFFADNATPGGNVQALLIAVIAADRRAAGVRDVGRATRSSTRSRRR